MSTLLFFACLLGFQETETQIQETLTVSFVLLDVVALNRRDQVVENLLPQDFLILEDDQPMELSYFEVLDLRRGSIPDHSSTQVVPNSSEEGKLQIIVVLDLDRLKLFKLSKSFKQLENFFETMVNDQPWAINIYDLERGSLTNGFINDQNTLKTLIEDHHQTIIDAYMERRRPREIGGVDEPLLLGDFGGSAVSRGDGPRKPGPLTETGSAFLDFEEKVRECARFFTNPHEIDRCIDNTLIEFLSEESQRADFMLERLEFLARSFENEPGLKLMLLVSPGFAIGSYQAAHDLAAVYRPSASPFARSIGNGIGLPGEEHFQRIAHLCIQSRIVFHTFDSFNHSDFIRRTSLSDGRRVSRIFRDHVGDVNRGLRILARESGGSFSNSGQLHKAIKRTLKRNQFFYVLGYHSPIGDPGAYRKIKLETKRKGVNLHSRRGYFGH